MARSNQDMRGWQLATPGPFDKSLKLVEDLPRIPFRLDSQQLFIRVLSAAINPADYKIAEHGVLAHAVMHFSKTAGMDFCGRVVSVGKGVGDIRTGELVLGRLEPSAPEGSLAEYVVASYNDVAGIPGSIDIDAAAGAPTAALTAYQCICPHVKKGDRVFINGGSGGTGTFGIQIAKALGCSVTVSCSAEKQSLCKELGADDTIDYTSADVTQVLRTGGQVYQLCVDNVGNSPPDLYTHSDAFLLPGAQYVHVGGAMTLDGARRLSQSLLLPRFLGGGRRKFHTFSVRNDHDDLQKISDWIAEGKLKTIVDSTFEFEEVQRAYKKLRGQHSRTPFGKIVIHVASRN